MNGVNFQIVAPDDRQVFKLIADWYFSEWNIPVITTIEKLQTLTEHKDQFQVLMTLNREPVATGGIYDHVGLIDKVPHLNIYKKWLALVYTIPRKRSTGLGTAICNFILNQAKISGIEKIHLFTDTAEPFYQRMGWAATERLTVNKRNIVVMEYAIGTI